MCIRRGGKPKVCQCTRLKDVDEMSCYRGRGNIKRGVRKAVWLTGVGGGELVYSSHTVRINYLETLTGIQNG